MSKGDYDIGYKKPPKHTQFQTGKSGNPGGRPKGSENRKEFAPLSHANIYEFQKQIIDAGYEEIPVIKDGQVSSMRKVDALISQLYKKAMSGDNAASKILLQYTHQSLEDLDEAGYRVYRTTLKMRECERTRIFTPPSKPDTHGAFLERQHLTYSVRFAFRELYGKDIAGEISPYEPETEHDWGAFNHKMKKEYLKIGEEPSSIDIPEIPSMYKL